jgi:hypothetical protein
VHAILLDAEYDFARFPFGSETPSLLLPVVGLSLLDRTLGWVAELAPSRISLITRRDLTKFSAAGAAVHTHSVQIFADLMSALRSAASPRDPLVILRANLHPLPNAMRLQWAHEDAGGVLSHARGTIKTGPGVYTYGPPVLFFVSSRAAHALSGRLLERPLREIPRILKERGVTSAALELDRPVVEIDSSFALYDANLGSLAEYRYELYGRGLRPLKPNLWAAEGVDIGDVEFDPRGGLVVVGANTRLEGKTALRGPAVIGADVVVGEGSCIHRGLVLDGTGLPPQSFVARAVVSPLIHEQVGS